MDLMLPAKYSKQLKRLWRNIYASRYLYLMLLPGILYFAIFQYGPMAGLQLAFKKYNARLGIWGSQWVGLQHFRRIFITPASITALKNTIEISLSRLVIEVPFPILLAVMLNEMRGTKLKRVYQTVYTFPHFLSWIVVAAILKIFLNNDGAINMLISSLGGDKVNFLAQESLFRPLLYFTAIWKEAGWSAIIYIAAIAGINQELYEAATIDGASRLQRVWHVTLPGIRTTIAIMFIMAVGNIMNGGFNQIFNLSNGAVKNVSDIIDTYVYNITFLAVPDYGFSTAVGLFKAVINFIMLLTANTVVRKLTGEGMFA